MKSKLFTNSGRIISTAFLLAVVAFSISCQRYPPTHGVVIGVITVVHNDYIRFIKPNVPKIGEYTMSFPGNKTQQDPIRANALRFLRTGEKVEISYLLYFYHQEVEDINPVQTNIEDE